MYCADTSRESTHIMSTEKVRNLVRLLINHIFFRILITTVFNTKNYTEAQSNTYLNIQEHNFTKSEQI